MRGMMEAFMARANLVHGILAGAALVALPASRLEAAEIREETCKTAVSAPSCVAKTWFGCRAFDPALCDLIAVSRGNFVTAHADRVEKLPAVARAAPWTLTFEQLGKVNAMFNDAEPVDIHYAGTRHVTPGRFKSGLAHDLGLEGSAEVMLEHSNADTTFTESVFVVPDGNHWRFTSSYMVYSMEFIEAYQELCDGSIPGSCGLRIPGIKPWPLVLGDGSPRKKVQ